MKSILRHYIGLYVDVVYLYALMGYFIADIFWQQGQFLMNVLTGSRIPNHMLFDFFKLRSVRCTPPCPTVVL